jgi:hypothetical protein
MDLLHIEKRTRMTIKVVCENMNTVQEFEPFLFRQANMSVRKISAEADKIGDKNEV